MNMTISTYGLELIKHYEGCKLVAYDDGTGKLTIGYGSTRAVSKGMIITQSEAEERLLSDVADAQRNVNSLIQAALSQQQFDALVDFTFNLGGGNLFKSTLRKRINEGDFDVSNEFLKWNQGGGKILQGLIRRRNAEATLFLGYGEALSTDCPECMQNPWDVCMMNGSISTVPHSKRVERGQFDATVGKETHPITDAQIFNTGEV